MKLWQKIFLLTLTLVIIVVNASSLALLGNNHRLAVEREQQSALAHHNLIDISLYNSVLYSQLTDRKTSLTNSEIQVALNEVHASQAQSAPPVGMALFRSKELIGAVGLENNSTVYRLLDESDYTTVSTENNGVTLLYICSTTNLNNESFQLVTSFDITTTSQAFNADFEQTRFIGIISALIIAGLLLLLVRAILSPLRNLSNTTDRIAGGDLDTRAKVTGHDEVSEVARNFNIMANSIERNVRELEDLAESRRIFIGNLAHEMKTPLTSILGFADILRIKRSVSDEDRVEYASVIVNETKRLQSLSGKLMELLTMGNLQVVREKIEVHSFAAELKTIVLPILESHQMHLECETPDKPCHINVDPELMKSLVFNLVDNAIKASEQGDRIWLRISTHDQNVTIEVADEGVGIPPAEIQYLTEPFYMLDKSRTRKFGGAGLGLALCHEIALAHDSELKIESEEGKGSRVSIVLTKED